MKTNNLSLFILGLVLSLAFCSSAFSADPAPAKPSAITGEVFEIDDPPTTSDPSLTPEEIEAKAEEALSPEIKAVREFIKTNTFVEALPGKKKLSMIEIVVDNGFVQDKPDKLGLTEATFKLMLRGADGLSNENFSASLAKLGISEIKLTVGYQTTRISCVFISANYKKVFDQLAKIFINPNFEPAEWDLLKSEIKSQLSFSEKNPRDLATRALLRGLYQDHPKSFSSAGNQVSVESIGAKDLKDLFLNIVRVNDLRFFIASDFSEHALKRALANSFSKVQAGQGFKIFSVPAIPELKGREVVLVPFANPRSSITLLGFRAPDHRSPDADIITTALKPLNEGQSSRLYHVLRELTGWTYVAGGSFEYTGEDFGILRAFFTPRVVPKGPNEADDFLTKNTLSSIALLKNYFNSESDLQDFTNHFPAETLKNSADFFGPLLGKEFDLFKESDTNKLALYDSASNTLDRKIKKELYGFRPMTKLQKLNQLNDFNVEDAKIALKRGFSTHDMVIVLVGEEARIQETAAKIPNVAKIRTLKNPYY